MPVRTFKMEAKMVSDGQIWQAQNRPWAHRHSELPCERSDGVFLSGTYLKG